MINDKDFLGMIYYNKLPSCEETPLPGLSSQIAEAETIKTSENNASMLAVLFSKKKFLNKC